MTDEWNSSQDKTLLHDFQMPCRTFKEQKVCNCFNIDLNSISLLISINIEGIMVCFGFACM